MSMIIHIDMDAFFAAVEQRDNPQYINKPVIIGADPRKGRGRGVVSAASYEARVFGIHSALPISQAYKKCPQGVFLPVDMPRYIAVSKSIMSLFADYTPHVEAISLDEAFLDMRGGSRLFGSCESVGREIKLRIREEHGLNASVGIAPSKMLAKIASDIDKPDGFVLVKPSDIHTFLDPLPIKKIWGIGSKTGEKLQQLGVFDIGQLRKISLEILVNIFGKSGRNLYNNARGIDNSPVKSGRIVKSISNESTFSSDQFDADIIHTTIISLSEKVGYRLRKKKMSAKTINIKIRFADFTTSSRSKTVIQPIRLGDDIRKIVLELFQYYNNDRRAIRLIGVGVGQLQSENETQVSLFDEEDMLVSKVSQTVDQIKKKFGESIIAKGAMFLK